MVPPVNRAIRSLQLFFQRGGRFRAPLVLLLSRFVARPTRFEHYRWLGDKRSYRVHDLDNSKDACGIDDLMASEKFQAFGPDLLAEAQNRGYKACGACVTSSSSADE